MVTETEARFKAKLREVESLINNSKLTVKDGYALLELCENLSIRYQQVRDSRDKWKKNYLELKKKVTNPGKRLVTNGTKTFK